MSRGVEPIPTATEIIISATYTIDVTGTFLLHCLSSHAANQEPCVLQANLHRCRLHFHYPFDQAPAPLLISKAQAPHIVLIVNRNSSAPHISTPSLQQRRDLLVHATHIHHFAAQLRCASLCTSFTAFLFVTSYTASWSPCKPLLAQHAQS
jgi:hypothetical protein